MTDIDVAPKIAYDMGSRNPTSRATQRLYRLDPPLVTKAKYETEDRTLEYVLVSAAHVPEEFDFFATFGAIAGGDEEDIEMLAGNGDETYIFPSNEKGEMVSSSQLPGSFQGAQDHERAIRNLGYEVSRLEEL